MSRNRKWLAGPWNVDIMVGAFLAVVGVLLMGRFDFFEWLYQLSRAYEDWELDELALGFPLLVLFLLVFSVRRVVEARRELVKRRIAEEETRKVHAELCKLSEFKEEFMAKASHELRSPLNGMMGLISTLGFDSLTEDQARTLDVIQGAGRNMHKILDDIIEFTRLGSSGLAEAVAPFEPKAILKTVHQALLSLAVGKGLEMPEPRLDDVPTVLVGVEGAVRQILLNLVGNAVKFTEEGRVDISAAYQGGGPGSGDLVLVVSDTGPGIPVEDRDTIFEPYRQLDRDAKKIKGLGLGLSLVKRLVDVLGGVVSVVSEPGKGATFEVKLPVSMPDEAEAVGVSV